MESKLVRRRPRRWLPPVLAFFLALGLRLASGAELYVSPDGDDRNAGTAESPVATIGRARDLLRETRSAGRFASQAVTIRIGVGEYPLVETLRFTEQDSGTEGAPVTYAAEAGTQAFVSGARTLELNWFRKMAPDDPGSVQLPAEARGHVWTAALRDHGLSEFGRRRDRGFERRGIAAAELSANGVSMTLARWPNRGAPMARTGAVASARQFRAEARAQRWSAETTWLHGFWAQPWADYELKMAGYDPATSLLSVVSPPEQFGLAAGQPFCVENVLAELDEPGEYFIETVSGVLYWWPPAGRPTGRIQLSGLETPLVRCEAASHLVFKNLGFEAGRAALVEIVGGAGVLLDHCALRQAGQYAVLLEGTRHGLNHCEIVDAGEEGVIVRGGDRATLQAGGNFVTHCTIRRAGRTGWSYRPGIALDGGCGNVVAHTLIEDLPHSAILFKGDNHRIESNEITRVCLLTGDAGAIYSGHDWGYRGNVIRHNFIHHLASVAESGGVHGVYLDDCLSGTTVSGNIFYRIQNTAVFCGGGRDTVIMGNMIGACGEGHFNDDRGRTRINATPRDYWNLLERLSAEGIRYREDPRAAAFPACAAIPPTWEAVTQGLWRNPEGCVFSGNVGWANGRWIHESNVSGTGVFALYAALDRNEANATPAFDEASSLDRKRRAATVSAALRDFVPIPFQSIGPEPEEELAPAPSTPAVRRTEIERSYAVIADVGKNGKIGAADGQLDSGESLRLYDLGDTVRVGLHVFAAGMYRLRFRVRCGGTTGRTGFWPAGYAFKLDQAPLPVAGDVASVSTMDPAYGGCYWGTMESAPVRLERGLHTVDLTAGSDWAVVDYLELASEPIPALAGVFSPDDEVSASVAPASDALRNSPNPP